MLAKFLKLVKTYQSDIILAITVILISIISFNLGRISASKDFIDLKLKYQAVLNDAHIAFPGEK